MKYKILATNLLIFIFAIASQAATFIVNSTNDGADANTADNICQTATVNECTLRAAIGQANATAGTDTHKSYNFAAQVVSVNEALEELNFFALRDF